MSFTSDAQRRWFFATGGNGGGGGGGSGGGASDAGGSPVLVGHWHTMTVAGVQKQVWIDADSDPLSAAEKTAIAAKEDRKSYEMQSITGGGWK